MSHAAGVSHPTRHAPKLSDVEELRSLQRDETPTLTGQVGPFFIYSDALDQQCLKICAGFLGDEGHLLLECPAV